MRQKQDFGFMALKIVFMLKITLNHVVDVVVVHAVVVKHAQLFKIHDN
jgi:hypothetical protein